MAPTKRKADLLSSIKSGKKMDLVQGDKLTVIDVDAVYVDPLNPRGAPNPNKIEFLKTSIEESGQWDPVDVVIDASGRYCAKRGQTRIAAIKSLRDEGKHSGELVILVRKNEEQADDMRDKDDELRSDLNIVEKGRKYKRTAEKLEIWGQRGCNKRLADHFYVKESQISAGLASLSWPGDVQELAMQGKVRDKAALAFLAKLPEKVRRKAITDIENGAEMKEIYEKYRAKPKKQDKIYIQTHVLTGVAEKLGLKTKRRTSSEILKALEKWLSEQTD